MDSDAMTTINGVKLEYDNAAEAHAIENPGHRVVVELRVSLDDILGDYDMLGVSCQDCEHWDTIGSRKIIS